MHPARSRFMEVFDAIAIVLASALLMWLVLTGQNDPAEPKRWLGRALLVVGWLWALTAGVIVETGRRRALRVGPVAAVGQALRRPPMIVVVVAMAIWAINRAFEFPWPFRALCVLAAAAVLPRILLVIAVRAVGLDDFWQYGADRSTVVITWVGGVVVVPYLVTACIFHPLHVLARVLVTLTEDFEHIDGVLSGLARGPQPR